MIPEGTVLSGKYRILRKIGSGGMSEVYRAVDIREQRVFAIKVLRDNLAEETQSVERFKKEAVSSSVLVNPNIVRVYGYDYDAEFKAHYIIMECVRGESLKTYIQLQKKLNSREVCHIAIRIADALACAHKAGLVHRDIKPQNVLLSSDGAVKVTDFGIAGVMGSSTISTQKEAMGSVHYMSPEQAKAQPMDARSDLYSLGISMYEMVTGTLPFVGETPVAVAMQHLNKNMPNPCTSEPDLWLGLGDIIRRLTQKAPENRYQDAESLASDLRMLLKNNSMRFKVYEPVEVAEDPSGMTNADRVRKSILTVLGAVAVTAVAVVATLMLYAGLTTQNEVNKIPSVMGLSFEEATKIVKSKGYTITEIARQYSDTTSAGNVILQEPLAGVEMEAPYEIKVIVSLGSKSAQRAPDLAGYQLDEAVVLLNSKNISFTVKTLESDQPMGTIISQNPIAGADFAEISDPTKAVMTIFVSGGVPEEACVVPYILGYTQSEASNELAAAGLILRSITFMPSDTVEAGRVIKQSVEAGLSVAPGTLVDITISNGGSSQSRYKKSGGYIVLCNPLTEGLTQTLTVTAIDVNAMGVVLYKQELTYATFAGGEKTLTLAYPEGTVNISVKLGGIELWNISVN